MTKEQIRKAIIDRLCRNARGYKEPAFHSKNITQQERDAIAEVIEEIIDYLENYEENTKWKELYIDDGR